MFRGYCWKFCGSIFLQLLQNKKHQELYFKESEDWTFRGYNRIRGSGEAITATKSTCSVPPSDASDTDDHDSVHSLPVGSTRVKVIYIFLEHTKQLFCYIFFLNTKL